MQWKNKIGFRGGERDKRIKRGNGENVRGHKGRVKGTGNLRK